MNGHQKSQDSEEGADAPNEGQHWSRVIVLLIVTFYKMPSTLIYAKF